MYVLIFLPSLKLAFSRFSARSSVLELRFGRTKDGRPLWPVPGACEASSDFRWWLGPIALLLDNRSFWIPQMPAGCQEGGVGHDAVGRSSCSGWQRSLWRHIFAALRVVCSAVKKAKDGACTHLVQGWQRRPRGCSQNRDRVSPLSLRSSVSDGDKQSQRH